MSGCISAEDPPAQCRSRWLVILVLAGGCTAEAPLFVAWPTLSEGSLSFFVSVGDEGRQIVGPIGSAGPSESLSFTPSGTTLLISFDESWLRSRHARVDAERLDQIALIDRPPNCAQCAGPCRGESDALIFHPVDGDVTVMELSGEQFEPVDLESRPRDFWVSLPARWDCKDTVASRDLRYVDRWSSPNRHWDIWDVGSGHHLLGGQALRKLGEDTTILPPTNSGELFLGAVPWGPNRALAIVRVSPVEQARGRLLELDLSGPLTVVREQELPVNPNRISIEDGTLLIPGHLSMIATSTDGETFRVRQLGGAATLLDARRFVDLSPSYLVSGTNGIAYQGDLSSEAEWAEFQVANIDKGLGPFFEVQGSVSDVAPDGRWLWTASNGRGIFERAFRGSAFRLITLEPPRTDPRCINSLDETCGFAVFPLNGTEPRMDGHLVFTTTSSCPRLLVARPELGCADSITPRNAFSYELGPTGGSIVVGRDLYVVMIDGVVAFPLD